MLCGKQISAPPAPQSLRTSQQAKRNPDVCLPSGVPLMSVGGPVLTVRLGFWVRAFCRVQSKLSSLSCTKPQIFSSSKRHVLSAGKGRGWSAAAFSSLLPQPGAAWALAASCTALRRQHCGSASSGGQAASPRPQGEAEKEYLRD